jgi:uncharacterized SAM-binding protein YcdF (DUF218 family)
MLSVQNLLKAFIDPVSLVLLLIAFGVLLLVRKRRHKIGSILLTLSFFILYAPSISCVSNGLCYILEKDYLYGNDHGKPDIMVILGGGISDSSFLKITLPSWQSASRILYAVQVFRKSQPDYLVCSGGGDGRLKEAEVMRNAAVRLGVPQDRIKLDLKSRNTREHAENLNQMFQDKGLRIGLVTSAYHMKRSEREFKKYFPYVIPLPSDYLYSPSQSLLFKFLPSSSCLYKTSTAFREIIALTWYKIGKP